MDIFLINFETELNKLETSKFQKCVSKIFANKILKDFYKSDYKVLKKSNKPYIKNNPLYLSIAHSENLVAIAYDKDIIGFDVEFIKKRDYEKILKFFNLEAENVSQIEFYQIWTNYEASFKSCLKVPCNNFIYKNYVCSLSSKNNTLPVIYEITIPKNKINDNELINLKLVKDSAKNENEVVIQEINIASLEFLPPETLKIE